MVNIDNSPFKFAAKPIGKDLHESSENDQLGLTIPQVNGELLKGSGLIAMEIDLLEGHSLTLHNPSALAMIGNHHRNRDIQFP